jgi:diaminopimelate epimerase
VTVEAGPDARTHRVSVGMGAAQVEVRAPEWIGGPIRRAARVRLGNPHLVVQAVPGPDSEGVDLSELGEAVNAKEPGGANVHLLALVNRGRIAVRSYERGVGPTLACGSGACAAAATARAWGLVDSRVRVDQPGGVAEVSLDAAGEATLSGPSALVATIELPVGWPWR